MSISLTIDTDNAAFEGESFGPEVARMLREVADELEGGRQATWRLFDSNGNACGEVVVGPEEEV